MSDLVERLSWWLRYFNDETDKWKDAHPDYRHNPTGFDETAIEGDLRDAIEKIQRLRKALERIRDGDIEEQTSFYGAIVAYRTIATKALKGEEK